MLFMRKRIFIGSSTESLNISYAIQETLEEDFQCTVWNQDIFKPSEYTLEALEETLDCCEYGIFVFSPDDKLIIRNEEFDSVRDNILFEFGLFVGRLGRENTFFVTPRNNKKIHLPSDLVGVTLLSYDVTRTDGNWNAALGPACNKIAKQIKNQENAAVQIARNQYDIINDKYPFKRSIRYLDTACVFASRTSFDNCIGVQRIFSQAKEIKAMGISLNSIILNWGRNDLLRLIQNPTSKLMLLFLDPESDSTKMRESDESLPQGTISQITRTNLNIIKRLSKEIGDDSNKLMYRLYDMTPYINMYIIDNKVIILQHYLSGLRGQEAPVFVIKDEGNESGLFNVYNALFKKTWEEAKVPNE